MIKDIYLNFTEDDALEIKEIEKITNHDVKAVEYYICKKLDKMGKTKMKTMVHFACTSEDINNLAYALMMRDASIKCLVPHCERLQKKIEVMSEAFRNVRMISRTHGQVASPTSMGKEFNNVSKRLLRQIEQMKRQEFLGKINGAVGNFNAHIVTYPNLDWESFTKKHVTSLGLNWNKDTTQIEPHDFLAEIFHNWIRWNTVLLDFNRDLWSYISIDAFKQISSPTETGSSTMPHKVNPIDFENSEGNLGLSNAFLQHLAAKLPISRWQRDLTDSTVLRNIGVAFGYALLGIKSNLKGLGKLVVNQGKLKQELSVSWELLGEALQTVMRRYSIPEPYEKLKELTRGKGLHKKTLREFISKLDLPQEIKQNLLELEPYEYIGMAEEF